jgi:hypothetical protein
LFEEEPLKNLERVRNILDCDDFPLVEFFPPPPPPDPVLFGCGEGGDRLGEEATVAAMTAERECERGEK